MRTDCGRTGESAALSAVATALLMLLFFWPPSDLAIVCASVAAAVGFMGLLFALLLMRNEHS